MLGKGLTGADLTSNLSSSAMKKLRQHSKKKRRRASAELSKAKMEAVREKLIRLAHENPELREILSSEPQTKQASIKQDVRALSLAVSKAVGDLSELEYEMMPPQAQRHLDAASSHLVAARKALSLAFRNIK